MHIKNTLENDFLTIYHGNLSFSLLKLKEKLAFLFCYRNFMPTGVESYCNVVQTALKVSRFLFLNAFDIIMVINVILLYFVGLIRYCPTDLFLTFTKSCVLTS